jgi:hypothetical protein
MQHEWAGSSPAQRTQSPKTRYPLFAVTILLDAHWLTTVAVWVAATSDAGIGATGIPIRRRLVICRYELMEPHQEEFPCMHDTSLFDRRSDIGWGEYLVIADTEVMGRDWFR